MATINDSSASNPTEMSEMKSNECRICELALQRLTGDIEKKIVEGAHERESTSFNCICRVPKELRKLKESAYTPRFVSIGPFHSKDHHILKSPVQNIKKSYANSLICRASEGSNELKSTVLMKCVGQMRESLGNAKKYYSEEVEEELNEEMLVIDGCFILELLYCAYPGNDNKSNDPIFGNILTVTSIKQDLLLLENQLPFFVLQQLFDLTLGTMVIPHTLCDFVMSFFGNMFNQGNIPKTTSEKSNGEVDHRHILHILHKHYHPRTKPTYVSFSKFMPSASDLEYAGVKFVADKVVSGEELNVKFNEPTGRYRWFHRAHFNIPAIMIDDFIEPFLRNLIAFEQCCPNVDHYFTSYADLMDSLINTTKDVEVLQRAEIIRNCLGADEDVVDLFNKLCKQIVYGEYYYEKTRNDAAEYSKRCWSDALAHLRRKYFATPWTFIAFCAGFMTFGISVFKFIRNNFH